MLLLGNHGTTVGRLYAFVDESGDLGLSMRSSKHITFAAVMTRTPEHLGRIPRRARRKSYGRHATMSHELKFSNSCPEARRLMLTMISQAHDLNIVALVTDKHAAIGRHHMTPIQLHEMLASELGLEIALACGAREHLTITYDARPHNSMVGRRFDMMVQRRVMEGCQAIGRIPPSIRVSRLDSMNCPGLQVADFAAGAIQRKMEMADSTYHDLVACKIRAIRVLDVSDITKRADPGRIIYRAHHGTP